MAESDKMEIPLVCPQCRTPTETDENQIYCPECEDNVGIDRGDFLDFMLKEELDEEFREFYETEGTRADEQGGPKINAQKFKVPNVLSVLPESDQFNRYLDMGCGGGWIIESLKPKLGADSSVGIDISATRLLEASERNPDSLLLRAPVENVPIADDAFDLITCLDVIEHIKQPHQLLREANRLSPNLVIKFPIEDTLFDRFQKEYWWPFKKWAKGLFERGKPDDTFEAHLHRFNFDSARKLLRQNGFSILNEHVILNPWTEGKSFMHPPAYNINTDTNPAKKFDFYAKRYLLKTLRMSTYALTGPLYYSVFNSGIYFYCKRSSNL